jgi:aspartyl-tRNA(Asn)/glutamyl-tRNA(Gln) amidotransferase subunit A
LKDLFDVAGVRTTSGSTFLREYVPQDDSAAAVRLRQAGAVFLGKTNLHEIALGVTNENPHYGACRNPHDPRCITGGSSGGSAAALAAGLCLGALGSDTGGSIRIPSSLCGVVGLKPTFGRISLRGAAPLSWNLDHGGPLARSVRDAAILLQALAGYDPQDPYSADAPVEDYLAGLEAGVGGWRVALAQGEFIEAADAPVRAAVQQAAQVFARLGATVEPVVIPDLLQMAQANGLMVVSDAAALHRERLEQHPEGFGADVRERLRMGAAYSAVEYIQARRVQSLAQHWFHGFFQAYDLLLLPATPLAAPHIGAENAVERARQLTRFTAPFNLSRLPTLALPCGWVEQDGARLPLGLQLVAGAWAERKLLCAGHAWQQAAWQQAA